MWPRAAAAAGVGFALRPSAFRDIFGVTRFSTFATTSALLDLPTGSGDVCFQAQTGNKLARGPNDEIDPTRTSEGFAVTLCGHS